MTTRVLVTDYAWPRLEQEQETLAPLGVELVVAKTGRTDELIELAADVEAILTCWAKVDRPVLDAAAQCRTVARYGIGLDNIDVKHATRLGMVVTNVPHFCQEEVADHTILMLLALARQLKPLLHRADTGEWGLPTGTTPTRIRGKILGLVGFGSIAQAVVPRARALGMDVAVFGRSQPSEAADGVRFVSELDELFAAADAISLHLPLTSETAKIIDADALSRMRPTALLLNTARGGLVDTDALVTALDECWIAGAGLDVTDPEPLPAEHLLRGRPNVLITSHTAFNSDRAITELARQAATNVADVLAGRRPSFVVNPEVIGSDHARFVFGT